MYGLKESLGEDCKNIISYLPVENVCSQNIDFNNCHRNLQHNLKWLSPGLTFLSSSLRVQWMRIYINKVVGICTCLQNYWNIFVAVSESVGLAYKDAALAHNSNSFES